MPTIVTPLKDLKAEFLGVGWDRWMTVEICDLKDESGFIPQEEGGLFSQNQHHSTALWLDVWWAIAVVLW